VAAAHIITGLQTIASRNVNPTDAVVVSVCSLKSSQVGAFNVIPEHVELVGTVRTFNSVTRDLTEARTNQIVRDMAKAMGAVGEIEYRRGYPPTVNSDRESGFAAAVGKTIFGAENVVGDAAPSMAAEDFAYMLLERPGAYIWLGQSTAHNVNALHSPSYDFNDEVIPLGASYLAGLVEAATE
jgi:metal-dependent amidase/aminoacylase/carboxypeptidase family protein